MGILLVDDDPAVQALVELTLQESGLAVVSVNDGLSALDVAIADKPDLILADFLIKGIDISTFIKKIQRRPALADTPIVLLFLGEPDSNAVALQLTTMHTILKKPLDPILLSQEVKKQMGIEDTDIAVEEDSAFLPIPDDFLSDVPETLEETEQSLQLDTDEISFDLPAPLEPEQVLSPAISDNTQKTAFKVDVDSEKVDEAIRKIVLEVVERVTWEIIPGVVDMAMPKGKIQSLVEQVVWEIVPPLAEIEIKKEIKRLQPDEGFSS